MLFDFQGILQITSRPTSPFGARNRACAMLSFIQDRILIQSKYPKSGYKTHLKSEVIEIYLNPSIDQS